MTVDPIAFHEHEMMRHFEAGRFASARWHCRIWTRLVAKKVQVNDGKDRPILSVDIRPTGTPSPYSGELKGE